MASDNSILVASNSKRIIIWDLKTCQEIHYISGNYRYISSVCLTPDNKYILFGNDWGVIYVYDLEKNMTYQKEYHFDKIVRSLRMTKNNEIIVATNILTMYDFVINLAEDYFLGSKKYKCCSVECHTDHISEMLFLEDDSKIITCGNDCTIKIWDANTLKFVSTIENNENCRSIRIIKLK